MYDEVASVAVILVDEAHLLGREVELGGAEVHGGGQGAEAGQQLPVRVPGHLRGVELPRAARWEEGRSAASKAASCEPKSGTSMKSR